MTIDYAGIILSSIGTALEMYRSIALQSPLVVLALAGLALLGVVVAPRKRRRRRA
nr:hypothetical protein [Leifsonia sp. Leaf325]